MNEAGGHQRRLELPIEIVDDSDAIELVSAWYSVKQVKIMTRLGTGLDRNPGIWGEILASIAENAALAVQGLLGVPAPETLGKIKASLDEHWHSGQASLDLRAMDDENSAK